MPHPTLRPDPSSAWFLASHSLFPFMHFMPQTNLADLPGCTHSSVPSLSLFPVLGLLFPLLYIQIFLFFKATQTPSLLLLEAMPPPLPSCVIICFAPRSTVLHLPVACLNLPWKLPAPSGQGPCHTFSAFLTMHPLPRRGPVNG